MTRDYIAIIEAHGDTTETSDIFAATNLAALSAMIMARGLARNETVRYLRSSAD